MGVINASALTALQTRINAERSRRGLGDVTFTGGVGSGQAIQAAHFNELRNATEGLNTLGSQTFNWTGTIATGASITDVLPQIDNFVTTLEGEALAGWNSLTPTVSSGGVGEGPSYNSIPPHYIFDIPVAAQGSGLVRARLSLPYQSCTVPNPNFNKIQLFVSSSTSFGLLATETYGLSFNQLVKAVWDTSNKRSYTKPEYIGTQLPDISTSGWCRQDKSANNVVNDDTLFATWNQENTTVIWTDWKYCGNVLSSTWRYVIVAIAPDTTNEPTPISNPYSDFVEVEAYY